MLRHTDLVGEEFAQGVIDRLSALDLEMEELPPGDNDRDVDYKRRRLQDRYDALSDELIRQLINWHRDSFKVRFLADDEIPEGLRKALEVAASPVDQAHALKLRAEAALLTAKAAEIRGEPGAEVSNDG